MLRHVDYQAEEGNSNEVSVLQYVKGSALALAKYDNFKKTYRLERYSRSLSSVYLENHGA
jgi:hypothetical protein